MATRILVGLGTVVLAVGVVGFLENAGQTVPGNWAKYFVGGLALHDAVLAPLTALAGVVLARVVPPRARPPIQAGAVVSAALVLLALPAATGNGANPLEPSLLPRDYTGNLLALLGAVWALVAVAVAVRLAGSPPPRRTDARPVPPSLPGW